MGLHSWIADSELWQWETFFEYCIQIIHDQEWFYILEEPTLNCGSEKLFTNTIFQLP